MKGSTDIMCRPSSPMHLAPTFQHRSLRSVRIYLWVIGAVLLGHVALAALLTQLPVQQLMPVSPQPIEIRWVELTPPPKPEPKIEPKPELPKPQSKPEPKIEPPKPQSKPEPVSAKPIPDVKPVAIAKPQPVAAAPKPISSIKPTPVPAPQPVVAAAAVPSPPVAPVLSTTTVVPAPRVVAPVVTASNNSIAAPVAPPQAVSTANNETRTVAIDGISYLKPPVIRFEPRSQAEYDAIGLLLLDLSVDADGKVTQVSIKQSSGNRRYDAAITYAMKRTKFNPYRVDGVAQPFTVTAPFEKSPRS